MNRKLFIRNIVLGLCLAFLPKILWPSTGECEEEMVDIPVKVNIEWVVLGEKVTERKEFSQFEFNIKTEKKNEQAVREYLQKLLNSEQNPERSVATEAK